MVAFGRSALDAEADPSLHVLIGNPLDAEALASAVRGQEALLSALGTRGLRRTSVRTDAARAEIEAMQRTGVRRLLVISSSLVDAKSGWLSVLLARTLLRHIRNDQRAMEELVVQSGVDWTVVRPALVGNGPLTRGYLASPLGSAQPASYAR